LREEGKLLSFCLKANGSEIAPGIKKQMTKHNMEMNIIILQLSHASIQSGMLIYVFSLFTYVFSMPRFL